MLIANNTASAKYARIGFMETHPRLLVDQPLTPHPLPRQVSAGRVLVATKEGARAMAIAGRASRAAVACGHFVTPLAIFANSSKKPGAAAPATECHQQADSEAARR